jgi:iron(III) transport system substrate-binding protein
VSNHCDENRAVPIGPSISRRAAIAGAGAVIASAAAAQAASAQTQPMAALVSAAKAEGSVIVDGPPVDAVREALVGGFQRAYGIPVSYIASGTSASGARVRAERAAGKYLLDAYIAGPDTPTVTFLPNGWLDKIEPILIAPDVVDKRKWKDGHLWYEDDGHTILRFQQYVFPELAVNTKLVRRGELTTWKSLLEPKWQGKLIAKDPATSGSGGSLTSYFYIMFGADFVKKLYVGQKPMLSREPRQAMQWLAEGTYPILVGPDMPSLVQFQQLGYPIAPIFPTDGPSVLSGGYGLVCLINKAPHPNAAKLFVNWLAGPAAQEAFSKATHTLSLRNDVKYDGFPSFLFPQKGTKYMDTYDYKFVTEQRDPALAKVRELLGE